MCDGHMVAGRALALFPPHDWKGVCPPRSLLLWAPQSPQFFLSVQWIAQPRLQNRWGEVITQCCPPLLHASGTWLVSFALAGLPALGPLAYFQQAFCNITEMALTL